MLWKNLLGWLLSLITLSPIYIVVMYSTLIVFRRDLETIQIFLGQVINLALNFILKKLINQPRPQASNLKDEGMPSNHCQFVAYFSTYFILEFMFRCKSLGIRYRLLYSILLMILLVAVAFSRIYLQYHTLEQTTVGIVTGFFFALLWHYIVKSFLNPNCVRLSRTPFFKWLCIRDYSSVEYASLEEYEVFIENFSKSRKHSWMDRWRKCWINDILIAG